MIGPQAVVDVGPLVPANDGLGNGPSMMGVYELSEPLSDGGGAGLEYVIFDEFVDLSHEVVWYSSHELCHAYSIA